MVLWNALNVKQSEYNMNELILHTLRKEYFLYERM